MTFNQLVGKILVGQTSGVKAFVDNYAYETTTDADTIFVKYVSSGADNIDVKFRQGESLKLEDATTDNDPTLVVVQMASNLQALLLWVWVLLLMCRRVSISSMVTSYRTKSKLLFCRSIAPNLRLKLVGTITETIVTPEDDPSLKDNAQGYSNYSAPGAHRLKINLESSEV